MSSFLLFILFYFMMLPFFCRDFLQALWSFFIVPSLLSQGSVSPSLSRSLQQSASHLCIFLYFLLRLSLLLSRSHPFPPTSTPPQAHFTHQLCLSSSLQPVSFLHLNPFDQEPVCSLLFPSYPPPPSPPFFSAMCVLPSLSPQLVKNGVLT